MQTKSSSETIWIAHHTSLQQTKIVSLMQLAAFELQNLKGRCAFIWILCRSFLLEESMNMFTAIPSFCNKIMYHWNVFCRKHVFCFLPFLLAVVRQGDRLHLLIINGIGTTLLLRLPLWQNVDLSTYECLPLVYWHGQAYLTVSGHEEHWQCIRIATNKDGRLIDCTMLLTHISAQVLT